MDTNIETKLRQHIQALSARSINIHRKLNTDTTINNSMFVSLKSEMETIDKEIATLRAIINNNNNK